MRFSHIISLSLALLTLITVSACGDTAPATVRVPEPLAPAPTATKPPDVETAPTPEPTVDPEFALEDLESATFDNPTGIDHKWFPMTPGTQSVFEGFTKEGNSQIPHSIIFTVTDLTKEV